MKSVLTILSHSEINRDSAGTRKKVFINQVCVITESIITKFRHIHTSLLLWSPIIFLPCDFYLLLSSSSSFFSSPNLSGRRLDVYRTSTHGVDLVRI